MNLWLKQNDIDNEAIEVYLVSEAPSFSSEARDSFLYLIATISDQCLSDEIYKEFDNGTFVKVKLELNTEIVKND